MVLMTAACTKGKAQELKSYVTDLCFLVGCKAKRLPISLVETVKLNSFSGMITQT